MLWIDSVWRGVVLGLVPMWLCPRIAGRVITVRLRRAEPGEHAPRHLGTAAIEAGGPGSVIVIQHHDSVEAAGWGGILSLAARMKGIEGVIVDGLCRDVDDSRDASFPVFARAATPMTARGRVLEASMGEPITVGKLTVRPDDYVIADLSGVVFVARRSRRRGHWHGRGAGETRSRDGRSSARGAFGGGGHGRELRVHAGAARVSVDAIVEA